jgi:hypothetical protein
MNTTKHVVDGVELEQHGRPWWYRLALRICPSRCREIPEADNPTWPDGSPRVLLRQVALVKRYVYLQQFACSEDARYMHSHPYRFMVALGLWGGYVEHRIAGPAILRTAPYCYTLDGGHVHHVQHPTAGHTSIFAGFLRAADGSLGDKRYFGAPYDQAFDGDVPLPPQTRRKLWSDHIRKMVARI